MTVSIRALTQRSSTSSGRISDGKNYNCKAIGELLERFDPDWASAFRELCTNNERHAEALDSAYTLRNSIAHGGEANRGVKGVEELYESAIAVVEALIEATRL